MTLKESIKQLLEEIEVHADPRGPLAAARNGSFACLSIHKAAEKVRTIINSLEYEKDAIKG